MSDHEGTYIRFVHHATGPKTMVWVVLAKDGALLGRVRWFGSWRCYAFEVVGGGAGKVFEQVCLREIADFVEARTIEHRHDVAIAKATLQHLREARARVS